MEFKPDTVLFATVWLGHGAINVPLVCQKCGKCCRILSHVLFDPEKREIAVENLEGIQDFLGVHFYEIVEEIQVDVEHVVMLNPCPFLRDGRCLVYPARPESCRSFPLFGDQGIGCPALKRFEDTLEYLGGGNRVDRRCAGWEDISSVKVKPPRDAVEKFLKIANKDELEMFLMLNDADNSFQLSVHEKKKGN